MHDDDEEVATMPNRMSTGRMSTDRISMDEVMESISGAKDALAVKRAFGEPYEFDGVMVIPVARIGGGAGGGGGEGTDEQKDAAGGGFGTAFGLGVSPMGVYEVRGAEAVWKPAVDVNRLLKGSQVLAGIVVVCTTLVLLRRRRS